LVLVIGIHDEAEENDEKHALNHRAAEKDDVGDGRLKIAVEFAFIKGPESHKFFPMLGIAG
jgi:hypothetical protein